MNLTWNVVTDEKCTQGGIRRIVLADKLNAKIGEGLTFSIPTGAIPAGTRVKLFVGFRHTCPHELQVQLNGQLCHDADFGMDSYLLLNDPTTTAYNIATYSLTLDAAADDAIVAISGNPAGIITYLELKIGA